MSNFYKQLRGLNINPQDYINLVKMNAFNNGYDANKIEFSNDNKHKLIYDNKIKFGAVGYNDYLIYLLTIDKQTALNERNNYRKRSYKTMENTKNDFSKASLSYYILW
jgi:hypothetical protein